MLLHDLILDRVNTHPDAIALVHGDRTLSYTELAAEVERTANGLVATGLAAGDRVAIYTNKRIESVAAYFAASLAGVVFVPVNPLLKPAQVRHILDDCDVSMLITTPMQAATLRDELTDCASLRELVIVGDSTGDNELPHIVTRTWSGLQELAASAQHHRRIDNDVAAILYTSGSTGNPKGVVLSHRNMYVGAVSVASYIENSPDDRILAVLPFSFDAGFSQMTTGFSVGASIILMDYLVPADVVRAAARYRATGLTGVPPLWTQLARMDWPDEASSNMRYFANTGGAMPTTTLAALRERLPRAKPFLMYGLTESFRSTYLPPEQVDQRPTSIGKAIPNAEILVVRDDGSLCAPGEPGELVHRGALVSLGYWNDPDRTAERFKPVPAKLNELPFDEVAVWSGDSVVRDEEGFLYFVGRKDDMIKSSGYRISPTEVEELVYGTGKVSECAALGIPHPDIGQAVVIAAHAKDGDDEAAKEIIAACKRALPNYMVPERIIWCDSLPRNPNGKIDRKQLAGDFADLFQDESE